MNPLQFGNSSSSNSTCGQWISIQNRENTLQSTVAQVVGVCDDCDYGSIEILNLNTLQDLAPTVPFDDIQFGAGSNTTLADLMDPISPLPVNSTIVSPMDLVNVVWSLTDAPVVSTSLPSKGSATPTPTSTPTATTTTTTTATPSPTQSSPEFTGRGTWYSDTNGQCGHSYSQSDMIVAVNQGIYCLCTQCRKHNKRVSI
jgi:hypothetical protein